MTRIISGSFRGKQIRAPKNIPLRPTTDFAKESLFNILNNHYYLDEIKVLDLFAGTGNISYEFASRGCKQLTCVDKNPACIKFINKTFTELKVENYQAVQGHCLEYLKREFIEYDVIFADPPFDFEQYEELVNLVFLNNLLKENGLLVVEHQARLKLDALPNFIKFRKYGNVGFSFFAPEENQ
jgi:16S rRNA (guanine(966)-N(2))-methyltransferase RsmD